MDYFELLYDSQSGCGYDSTPLSNYITVDTSLQKGTGVGGFLKGIYRSALPILKKGGRAIGKAAGKEAIRAGINILDDVTNNKKSFKESIRNNARESGNNLKRKAEENLDRVINGSGYKAKRRMKKHQSSLASAVVNIKKHSKVKRKKKGYIKKKGNIKKKNKTGKERKSKKKKIRTVRDIFEE